MQKSFKLETYSKSSLKTISLLHRNIGRLEKVLRQLSGKGGKSEVVVPLGQDLSELDTLELARRGRQEQARVIAEMATAGVERLAKWARKLRRSIDDYASAHLRHGLKGN
jgi:hypothetical protein